MPPCNALHRAASSFLQLIDNDPRLVIYGVTTAMGELASRRLGREERDRHARLKPVAAATSFGDPMPDRVVRAIVLARLANFLEGHAATTPRIALAVAAMLDGGALPAIAGSGQGGAGEILALYPLFADLAMGFDLEVKERGSLINGSPCAAALVADSALAARQRVRQAQRVFALSIEAFGAPLEHYDAALDTLWGDEHEAAALRGLRSFLIGAGTGRRNYQAPVSYRIVPRVLGHAHRALAAAERAATVSLSAASDNPVYVPPDAAHPFGRCLSTGGYHNAMAPPALDDLAAIWADLCLLCDRHSAKLITGRVSLLPDLLQVDRDPGDSDGHGAIGYVPMAVTGYLEQAKAAAQRTFIPGSEPEARAKTTLPRRCFSPGPRRSAPDAVSTRRSPCSPWSRRKRCMSPSGRRRRRFTASSRSCAGSSRRSTRGECSARNSDASPRTSRGASSPERNDDLVSDPERQSLRRFLAALERDGALLRRGEIVDPRFEVGLSQRDLGRAGGVV